MLDRAPSQPPTPGGSKEKKSSKKAAVPAQEETYPYGDPRTLRNEGPFDPVDAKSFTKKPKKEKAPPAAKETAPAAPKAANAKEVAKKVGPKHEEMRRNAEQETKAEKALEDKKGIEDTIAILRTAAIDAGQEGKTDEAKKYVEVMRELSKRAKKIGGEAPEALTRHQFGAQAERVEEAPVGVDEQMAKHGVFETGEDELKKVLQKLNNRELGRYADMAGREHLHRTSPAGGEEPAIPLPRKSAVEERLGLLSDRDLDRFATVVLEEARRRNEIGKKGLEAVEKEFFPDEKNLEPEGGIETWSPEDWKKDQEDAGAAKRKINPPEETTPEQWEAHYKDAQEAKKGAENYGYVVSTEKLTSAVREVALERGKIIDEKTPEQHKGFMRSLAERYRALPKWSKYAIGATLLASGVAATLLGGPASVMTALWIAQRGMSGFGAYAIADAATERWKSRYLAGIVSGGVGIAAAFAVPSFVQYLDQNYLHIGDWLRGEGFGKSGGPAKIDAGNPLFDPNATPGAPAFVGVEHLFDSPIQVTDQDRLRGLWGILERKLADANIIDASTPSAKKNLMIDFLEKKLQALGPDGVKNLGFVSGDINVIHTGEKLDLSVLDKEGWIKQIKLFR